MMQCNGLNNHRWLSDFGPRQITSYRFKQSMMIRPCAKTQSTPCQHIHCTPSSFLSPLPFSLALHVGCLGVSRTSYSPNPKQIGFRHRRKPSVWPSPRRLLRRNPINRQHMAIGYGMDYRPCDVCGPLAAPMVTCWCSGTHSEMRRQN